MRQLDEYFDSFRQRVAMYTGENTLTSIHLFLSGYSFAVTLHALSDEPDPFFVPDQFHDWVAYRLHFYEPTSSWCSMIRERTSTEQEAIDRFFELLAEFRNRRPHVVAKLTGFTRTYQRIILEDQEGNGEGIETLTYPDSISLVTYTDDPGFFAFSDTSEPFPDLESFELHIGADRSLLTMIDPDWVPTKHPSS